MTTPLRLKFVKQVRKRGYACVYKLSRPQPIADWSWDDEEPKQYTDYIVVSAVELCRPGSIPMGLPDKETYIFACDRDGKWLSKAEQPGSIKDTIHHRVALKGYLEWADGDRAMTQAAFEHRVTFDKYDGWDHEERAIEMSRASDRALLKEATDK